MQLISKPTLVGGFLYQNGNQKEICACKRIESPFTCIQVNQLCATYGIVLINKEQFDVLVKDGYLVSSTQDKGMVSWLGDALA